MNASIGTKPPHQSAARVHNLSFEPTATGLITAGETSFLVGIALLGKETRERSKAVFRKK